jgi:hypothetical protein
MNTSETSLSAEPAPSSASSLRTPLNIAALVTFILGIAWRCLHIFKLHDPHSHADSDMRMYLNLAKKFATPGFVPAIDDVTHPPATAMLFSWFFQRDPTYRSLINFQAVITCLVPLAVAGFALAVFDKRTAKWALIVSSLYFPFIDYGGYFLSEEYMIFLNPLTAALFIASAKQKSMARVVGVGLIAGVAFFVSMAFKMVAFPAMLGFCGLYWLFSPDASRKFKTIAVLTLFLGAAPGTAALSARCTKANEGHFCLVSNKSPADFLLGHYGRIQSVTWKVPALNYHVAFGSPAAYQRGYKETPVVPFKLTDGPNNNAAAWKWIGTHKVEALVLSCEHVYDTFCGSLPWPSIADAVWPASEAFHFIFLAFLLLPSLAICLDVMRRQGLRKFLESRELLTLSLVFGLVAAVFLATGEARYRAPYDSVFILLAIRFYFGFGRSEPALAATTPEAPTSEDAVSAEPAKADEEASAEEASAPEAASEPA